MDTERTSELLLYILDSDPRRPEPMPVTVLTSRLWGEYGISLGTSEARRVLNDLTRRGKVRRHVHRSAAGVLHRDRYSLPT